MVQKKELYTGPKIFLQRLIKSGLELENISLLNPSLEDYRNYKRDKRLLIGRLDGTSYYDFTLRNLNYFLSLRNYFIFTLFCKLKI